MPTEAQWEYASLWAGEYSWWSESVDVGKYPANEWGSRHARKRLGVVPGLVRRLWGGVILSVLRPAPAASHAVDGAARRAARLCVLPQLLCHGLPPQSLLQREEDGTESFHKTSKDGELVEE